jgi:phosphopantothenoylcysteine decarboxylase/phosphopantothenate--cysteine ligase
MLNEKKIVIGITGGIAAYKIPELVRLYIRSGAEVKVVLTESAKKFVTPETLAVLSKNTVYSEFFDSKNDWNSHVSLAEWADYMIIAPLTVNTLAKMATGFCDNLLMAVYQSAKCPIIAVPAMDLEMYKIDTTQKNIQYLKEKGINVIDPKEGELASGLMGKGRMAEPLEIFDETLSFIKKSLPWNGKKLLINAGPTYEAIDPVRFIGNRSSGKMGIAIADYAASIGASVTLVLGPSAHRPKNSSVKVIPVECGKEMFVACKENAVNNDILIFSAAVSDYRPKNAQKEKIKKTADTITLELEKTIDILSVISKEKRNNQFVVGFALETQNAIEYAKEKMAMKQLDMIVVNLSENESGQVFGSDFNQISILDKSNKITNFELMSKEESAKQIVLKIKDLYA